MVRLIKRYGSRKLYDTEESRYVSLDEIGEWVRAGQEIRVIDNKSRADVTSQTLAQVILEGTRDGSASSPPAELLHELIRRGETLVSSGVEQVQTGVDRLLQASLDRLGPVRRAREEADVLRQRLDELEASLSRMEAKADGSGTTTDEETNRKTDPSPLSIEIETADETVVHEETQS